MQMQMTWAYYLLPAEDEGVPWSCSAVPDMAAVRASWNLGTAWLGTTMSCFMLPATSFTCKTERVNYDRLDFSAGF